MNERREKSIFQLLPPGVAYQKNSLLIAKCYLSAGQLATGNHSNNPPPRQRITDMSDTQLGRKRLKLIKQGRKKFTHDRSAFDVAFLHALRGHVLLANSNVPDVLQFRTSGKVPCHLYNRFFSMHQSSGQITPTAARNVYSIVCLSPKLMWLRFFAV